MLANKNFFSVVLSWYRIQLKIKQNIKSDLSQVHDIAQGRQTDD